MSPEGLLYVNRCCIVLSTITQLISSLMLGYLILSQHFALDNGIFDECDVMWTDSIQIEDPRI